MEITEKATTEKEGLEDLVWPPKILSMVQNYGELEYIFKQAQ